MNKKILAGALALLMLVSILAFTACNVQRRPGPNLTSPVPGTGTTQDTVIAKRLADRIKSMKEVNTATVIVSGNRAWVGIDLKANVEKLTTKVKDDITNIVKKEDKNIKTVYVTADADTVTRLRNIARDIAEGRPVSGFLDELNAIGKRITPSMK